MLAFGVPGKVKEGPLKGWWIKIQECETPKGFLVSRARNVEMDQTLVLDGIFPTREAAEAFLAQQAPAIDWNQGTA